MASILSYAKSALLATLPAPVRCSLKVRHYARTIKQMGSAPEPECAVVRMLVREGDTVVDVGANFGLYTHFLASLVGPSGRILSIEPIPETYTVLDELTRRSGLTQVRTHRVAATDRAGYVRMDVPETPGGYYEARVTDTGSLRVRGETLDTLLATEHVQFVKMDVEAHEASAIRGAMATLSRDRPALLIEVSAYPAETADAKWMFGALAELGYVPYGPDLRPWDGRHETNWFFLTPHHTVGWH